MEFFEGDRCWDAVEGNIRAYKDIGDTLAVEEIRRGKLLVVDGVRIISPHSVWGDLFGRLHRVHKGANTTVWTAQSLYYWPGMANAVRQLVEGCEVCKIHQWVLDVKTSNDMAPDLTRMDHWIL